MTILNERKIVVLNEREIAVIIVDRVRESSDLRQSKKAIREALQLLGATSHNVDMAMDLVVEEKLLDDMGDEFVYTESNWDIRRKMLLEGDLLTCRPAVVEKLVEHFSGEDFTEED